MGGGAISAYNEVDGALDAARRAERRLAHVRAVAQAAGLLRGEWSDELRAVEADFAAARRALRSPFVSPLRALPVVGRQLRSADHLTTTGVQVVAVAVDSLDELRGALDGDLGDPASLLAALETMRDLAARADATLATVDLGPDEALFPRLRDARNEVQRELAELRDHVDRGRALTDGLLDLLRGPSRYLLLGANNAEMQNGWGMPLIAGELAAEGGSLTVGDMTSTTELRLPPGAAPLRDEFAARWGFFGPDQEWRNLAVTARFDVAAEQAARMWEAHTGQRVDGVLAIDVLGLQALLRGTGPVEVDGTRITPRRIVPYALHDQYLVAGGAGRNRNERQERLAAIATSAIERLQQGRIDGIALADALADAVRGRHLLAWSADPAHAQAWEAAGATGALREDSLLVSLVNRGGNKLDWFTSLSIELETASRSDGGTDVAAHITITNATPPGEPTYIAGPSALEGVETSAPGDYLGYLTVQAPGAAEQPRFDGFDALHVDGPDGPARAFAVPILLPAGEERTIVARFTLPADLRQLTVEPTGRWPRTSWTAGETTWLDQGRRTLSLP